MHRRKGNLPRYIDEIISNVALTLDQASPKSELLLHLVESYENWWINPLFHKLVSVFVTSSSLCIWHLIAFIFTVDIICIYRNEQTNKKP